MSEGITIVECRACEKIMKITEAMEHAKEEGHQEWDELATWNPDPSKIPENFPNRIVGEIIILRDPSREEFEEFYEDFEGPYLCVGVDVDKDKIDYITLTESGQIAIWSQFEWSRIAGGEILRTGIEAEICKETNDE